MFNYRKVYGNGYLVLVILNFRGYEGGKFRLISTNSIDVNVHPVNEGKSNSENVNSENVKISYKDMLKVENYMITYKKKKSKPDNIGPGVSVDTLSGYSLKTIEKTIEQLKSREFQFEPSKKTYIPKSNGKLRPFGIPSPRDKIVQEVYLNLLEKVYEKEFLNTSHGFRPKRNCHTALNEVSL